MRIPLSLLLVALVATCPIVCGTAHAMSGDGTRSAHRHAGPDRSGLPAPANDDDCLCNGALKAAPADLGVDLSPAPHGLDMAFALIAAHLDGPFPPNLTVSGLPAPSVCSGVRGAARLPFLRC